MNPALKYLSPTDIYTLSLHDALPIWESKGIRDFHVSVRSWKIQMQRLMGKHEELVGVICSEHRLEQLFTVITYTGFAAVQDRKSTRLNSSHLGSSYAVFCLKKKIDTIRMIASTSPTSSGSSALVASSNSITSGSIASVRAIATRCCCLRRSRRIYCAAVSTR